MFISQSQSLDFKYFAKFSGVGDGKRSGVNKVAFFMFPFIFILPFIISSLKRIYL